MTNNSCDFIEDDGLNIIMFLDSLNFKGYNRDNLLDCFKSEFELKGGLVTAEIEFKKLEKLIDSQPRQLRGFKESKTSVFKDNFFYLIQEQINSNHWIRKSLILCNEIKYVSANLQDLNLKKWIEFWDKINNTIVQEKLLTEISETKKIFEIMNLLFSESLTFTSNKKRLLLFLFNQINENYENEVILDFEQLICKEITQNDYQDKLTNKVANYKNTFALLRNSYLTDSELENLIFSDSSDFRDPKIVNELIFEAYKECLYSSLEDKISLINEAEKFVEIYYYVSARTYHGNFTFRRFSFLMFLLSKIKDETLLRRIAEVDAGRVYSLVIDAINDDSSSFVNYKIPSFMYGGDLDEYDEFQVNCFDNCVSCFGTLLSMMKSPVLAALNLCDTDEFRIPIYILRLFAIKKQIFTEFEKKYLSNKLLVSAQQNGNVGLLRTLKLSLDIKK